MEIALHRDTNHNRIFADVWAEHLKARDVDIRWVDLTDRDPFSQVKGCDGVMWWSNASPEDKIKAYRIMHSIELYLGIPVFPDHHTSWHYDDKLSVHHMLEAADVPTPETWVFWDKDKAKEWALETDYPKDFKLSRGAEARNVTKVTGTNQACRLIDRMFSVGIYGNKLEEPGVIPKNWVELGRMARRFDRGIRYILTGHPPVTRATLRYGLEKGYALFQEFIPHEFETRVWVIGDKIWAGLKFPPPGDFQASGPNAIGFETDPSKIDLRCVQMAIDICQRINFHSMAIDFILRDGEPVVTDIGCVIVVPGGNKDRSPGCWDRNLNWIEGPTNRKEAEVEVFLERIRSANTVVDSR